MYSISNLFTITAISSGRICTPSSTSATPRSNKLQDSHGYFQPTDTTMTSEIFDAVHSALLQRQVTAMTSYYNLSSSASTVIIIMLILNLLVSLSRWWWWRYRRRKSLRRWRRTRRARDHHAQLPKVRVIQELANSKELLQAIHARRRRWEQSAYHTSETNCYHSKLQSPAGAGCLCDRRPRASCSSLQTKWLLFDIRFSEKDALSHPKEDQAVRLTLSYER